MRALVAVLSIAAGCEARAVEATAADTEYVQSMVASAEMGPQARGTVILVPLGSFPDDFVDAVELELAWELQVRVVTRDPIALPRTAYYAARRRYRAEKLLETLAEQLPADADSDVRVLGLTEVDISTTNGSIRDWGIFGLADIDGPAAVVSSHRLRRKARDRAHVRARVANTALHEAGHAFGLPHCDEAACPMQDADGGITTTDTSQHALGPACRAELDELHPIR